MRFYQGSLLHSPSDLVRFLGCAHRIALDLRRLGGEASLADEQVEDDAMALLVQAKGLAHEEAYRARLAEAGGLVEIAAEGLSLEQRAAQTEAAMREGAPAIFQAAFLQPPWHGFADFLIRVEEPSRLGGWSYEPVDTKLARSVKPAYLVQLGLYAQMMAGIQGRAPRRLHVALGSGETESFRLADFARTLAFAERRYLDFVAQQAAVSAPEPCEACGLCGWRAHCKAQWEAEDHLSRVSGLTRPQAARLQAAGIATVAALAGASEDFRVARMPAATFARLRRQAQLQKARWAGGDPVVEALPIEQGRGFTLLPAPDPADLFFDLEGDPLTEGGLDYLWGLHFREGDAPKFRAQWAHTHADERHAFESTIDWMVEHLRAHPGAHVYHYAPYEITALRRLSTLHASREDALDGLLRARRFVDLYGVLRQAIRTSEENLSLKTMEVFFAKKREEAVTKADQSIVEYKHWQETGDPQVLQGILDYNQVDCENTEGLRDWLVELRMEGLPWRQPGAAKPEDEAKTEARLQAEADEAALIAAVLAGQTPPSPRARELVGHLVPFHRRADKPAWWAMFDRAEREADELADDGECIGGIVPDVDGEGQWQSKDKRSTIAHYRFAPQDTKLKPGDTVLHAPSLRPVGKIDSLDADRGRVSVKRALKAGESFPVEGALIPEATVNNAILVRALRRVAECWAAGREQGRYQALIDLLERRQPRLHGGGGGAMVRAGESLVEAVTLRCLELDHSYLFIQGPPGTGKTHTSAHAIVSLLAAGKKVGVASNSHKAINNLMGRVEAEAIKAGVRFCGVKKASATNPDSALGGQIIQDVLSNQDVLDLAPDLIGGTAWAFAEEGLDQYLDYLFIDEAGQVSLGNLLAMGAAARNIVLVGDQMQLAQPIQGSHPGDSGLSVLDYLLEGEATVAPDYGILLDTSWRMHPEICGFISQAVYDGRLLAHPDCGRQRLHLGAQAPAGLASHGICFVPMDHTGCAQRSDAEAARVAELAHALIGVAFTNRQGEQGLIDWENILVVAPYNMQVNALKAVLPKQARVGTVDKFQGQEAEVVLVSLATSTPDDLPRHVEFFYSKNRLNVAISRARTLAVVLANPRLLELDAKSVEHLRLVNTLAWLAEAGAGG